MAPRVLNRGAGSKWGCGPCQSMCLAKWSSYTISRWIYMKFVVDGVTLQWEPSYESVAISAPSPSRHHSITTYNHGPALTTRTAQSVKRLATGWTVRGSNPGGGEIFRTCPDRPWGPPSFLYNRNQVFPGGKAAEAWRWPPTPSSTKLTFTRLMTYIYNVYIYIYIYIYCIYMSYRTANLQVLHFIYIFNKYTYWIF